MFKAPVYTTDGDRADERDLPEALFDGVVHQAAMWQVVKAHRANQRQATASAKTRSQVRGGGAKPWRQKGTGRARHGSIRSPIWSGGGIVFGPSPERNYRQAIPKKLKRLARRSAFNARAEAGAVRLVESIEMDAPKTKRIAQLLDGAESAGKVLVLTDGHKPLVHRSARNIPRVEVRPMEQASTYDLLWADTLVIEVPALENAAEVEHA